MVPLLVPWLGIALVDFGFVALGILVVLATAEAGPATTGGVMLQIVAAVQVVAIMTLRVSLLDTVRRVALDGPGSVGDAAEIARGMLQRLGPAFMVTVVVGLIVSIGLVLCILPGLVALFFFAFAPYLVVARNRRVMDALRESAKWATREWLLLLTALVVVVVAVGLWSVLAGLLAAVGFGATVGVPVGLIGSWVINTVVGYLAFLWWGAVYVTADSRRQVRSLRESRPGGGDREGPRTYEY